MLLWNAFDMYIAWELLVPPSTLIALHNNYARTPVICLMLRVMPLPYMYSAKSMQLNIQWSQADLFRMYETIPIVKIPHIPHYLASCYHYTNSPTCEQVWSIATQLHLNIMVDVCTCICNYMSETQSLISAYSGLRNCYRTCWQWALLPL